VKDTLDILEARERLEGRIRDILRGVDEKAEERETEARGEGEGNGDSGGGGRKERERDSKLLRICELLNEHVPYYDWVGFYLIDPEKEGELILGPYVGEPTDHTNISFGQGICGQAAEREETFVVQDVNQQDNYLSCSIKVKSEIVVPIFSGGKVVGEIDIDSHIIGPFTEKDSEFLEKVAVMVAPLVAPQRE